MKECIRSYFLHRSTFCLGCLFTTSIWQAIESACYLRLLVFLEIESLLRSGIAGPRFFPRVIATMISKCFVKLGIIVYFGISQKIWSKDGSLPNYISLLITFLWKGLQEREGKIKNRKLSLNFFFGQGSCLISDFTRQSSNKALLVQVFLRFRL